MKKLYRITAALLAILMLCSLLSACGDDEPEDDDIPDVIVDEPTQAETEPEPTEPFTYAGSYIPVESRYAYYKLSEGQKKLYDELVENCEDIDDEKGNMDLYEMPELKIYGYQLDTADIRVALRAITDDNPYLFWFSHTFSHYEDEEENYTMVRGYSEFSASDVERMRSQLDDAMEDFFDSVDDGLSEYEREKLVHDYIIDSCEYDHATADSDEETEQTFKSHSAYGAIVEHKCVCEGYGTAMQLLLNRLGLECVSLTGMSYDSASNQSEEDSVLHLWNAVKLDGEWYHVDPTWDDQEQEFQRHNYFNLNDDRIKSDHTLSIPLEEADQKSIEDDGTEDLNIFIPDCGGTKYYYYEYECPHLTDPESDELEDALYDFASSEGVYFTFYIDPDYLEYDSTVKSLFKEQPQYFFDYAKNVNERLADIEIDTDNMGYYLDDDRCAVTVELKYL